MAEFEPVGVRAVVEGAEKFIADLNRMTTAVVQFYTTAGRHGSVFQTMQTGAAGASQQMTQFATTTGVASQAAVRMGASSQNASSGVRGLGLLMGGTSKQTELLGQRLAFLAVKNVENANATNRAIAGNTQLSNSLVGLVQKKDEVIARYEKSVAALNKLVAARKREEAGAAKNRKTMASLEKQNNKLVRSQQQLGIALNNARTNLKKKSDALSREEASTKRTAESIHSKTQAVRTASDSYQNYVTKLQQAQDDIDQVGMAHNRAQAAMFQHSATAQMFGNDISEASDRVGRLKQEIDKVDSSIATIKRLGAALVILKGSFSAATRAASLFGKALLLPHTLMKGMGGTMTRMAAGIDKTARGWFKMGNSIRFFGMSMTFLVSLPIIGFLGSLTKAAIDFETAFAGVIKTVDGLVVPGTLNELNEMGEALRNNFRALALEIPFSAIELSKIGQVAGQLGVRGVGNITSFVDAVARIGSATDLSAEDAGRFLAQIIAIGGPLSDAELAIVGFTDAQVAGLSKSEKFQAQIQAVGGTLVELGNNLPTTEEAIARFTQRIAASGELANIATADLFGIAAAFASVGIPAERGGTAVQKTFIRIIEAIAEGGRQLEIFAQVSGVTTEEFATAFAEGSQNAGETFTKFIEGLGDAGDKAIIVLDELDLNNQRVINSLLSAANAASTDGEENKRMSESVEIANRAFKKFGGTLEEYNALQLESERRFATTESQLKILKNQYTDMGITIGSVLLPPIIKLAEYLRAVISKIEQFGRTEGGKKFIQIAVGIMLVVAAIGPVIVAFGLLLSAIGFIGLAIAKVVAFFGLIFGWFGILVIPILALVAAIAGLAIAFIASFKKIEKISGEAAKGLIPRMWEFGSELILAFARGMAAAMMFVVQVLIAIGAVIAEWLRPGSPPKIAPDLDKWGEEAMNTYLKGWLSADFGIFNDIAGKVEGLLRSMGSKFGDGLIPKIIGSRKAIAAAVNEIKKFGKLTEAAIKKITKAVGKGSGLILSYVEALLEVKKATDLVKESQEELTRITREYEESLRPLTGRLKEISDRQKEVADNQLLQELNQILSDPRASNLARELASLQIEQIGLEQQVDLMEDARDTELSIADIALEAAEAQQEAAEAQLDVAEQMLDFQIKNNQLAEEYLGVIEKATKALGDAVGDLDLGIDPEDIIPDPGDLGEDMFDAIDTAVQGTIDDISEAFLGLIEDLKTIFDPLTEAWDKLGDTWAPIFDRVFEAISPVFDKLQEGFGKTNTLMARMSTLGDEIVAFFVNLGVIGVPPDMQRALDKAENIAPLEGKIAEQAPGAATFDADTLFKIDDISARGKEVAAAFESPLANLGTKLSGHFEVALGVVQGLWETIQTIIDEVVLTLIELNVIEPFGKYVAVWDELNSKTTRYEDALGSMAAFEAGQVVFTQEELDRFEWIIANGEPTSGLFDRIRGSLSDLWEKFKESDAAKTIVTIFKAMLLVFAPAVAFFKTIADVVTQNLWPAIQDLGEPLGNLMDAFKDLYTTLQETGALNVIVAILGIVYTVVNTLMGLLWSFVSGALLGAITGMVGFLGGVINAFAGLIRIVQGIVQVIVGIVNFILGWFQVLFGNTEEGFDRMGMAVDQVINGIKDIITGIFEYITGYLGGIWAFISGGVSTFVDTIVGFFTNLYNLLVGNSIIPDMINGIIEWFVTLYNDVVQWVTDLVNGAIELFTGLWTDLVEGISTFVTSALEFFTGLKDDIIGAFTKLVTEGPAELAKFVAGILTGLTGFVTDVAKKALEIGQAIIDGIVGAVSGGATLLLDAVKGAVGGLVDGAKSFLGIGSPSKEFVDIGKETINGLVEGVKKAQAVLDKMLKATVKLIIGAFSGVFKAIGKVWGKGIKGNLSDTKKWLTAMIKMTIAWGEATAMDGEASLFGSVFVTIIDMFMEMARVFLPAYQAFLEAVASATQAWGEAMAMGGKDSLFGSVFVIILEMFQSMVEAFVAALPAFLELWVVMIDDILEKFEQEATNFYNAGASLIDSLAQGMLSRAQSLYQTAARIADGVTDAVNDANEATSPSKVYIGVGKNIMEGWSIGLENNQGRLFRTMDSISGKLLAAGSQAGPASMPSVSSGPMSVLPAPVPAASSITNANVDMGGQVVNNGIDQVMLQILIEQALRNVL